MIAKPERLFSPEPGARDQQVIPSISHMGDRRDALTKAFFEELCRAAQATQSKLRDKEANARCATDAFENYLEALAAGGLSVSRSTYPGTLLAFEDRIPQTTLVVCAQRGFNFSCKPISSDDSPITVVGLYVNGTYEVIPGGSMLLIPNDGTVRHSVRVPVRNVMAAVGYNDKPISIWRKF